MDFKFLTSTRFWIMTVGCLGIAAQGGFTWDAWFKALEAFVVGFIGIRTVDRAAEKMGSQVENTDV